MYELLDLDAAGEDDIANDLDEDTVEALLCEYAACMCINDLMYVIYPIGYCTSCNDEETARVTVLWLKITGSCASVIDWSSVKSII